nr:hypothetical protein GCM10025699_60670 [Microbacterium flavescens]
MTVIETRSELGSARGRVWGQLRRNRLGLTGGVMLLVVLLLGVLAPLIAPHGPTEVNFDAPFQMPGTVGYLLGTDDLGRDILSRMLHGIRVSLVVGVLSVLLAVVVGTPSGCWPATGAGSTGSSRGSPT